MTQSAVRDETRARTGLISGTVFRGEDGDRPHDDEADIAIPHVTVRAWLGTRLVATARTDDHGRFTMSAPVATGYTLKVSLPAPVECYDPESKAWGRWSTVEGRSEGVACPARDQQIGIRYRMLNYGPRDFSWELWHEGPAFKGQNVVLVHGFEILSFSTRGRCDKAFGDLDRLLQAQEDRYNVWQFEFTDRFWGTPHAIETYAASLGKAVNRISRATGSYTCSIVAYSMGGIIARRYIALGGKPRVDKLLTLATPHMGTAHYAPFDLELFGGLYPRAAMELRPASSILWGLNTDTESSLVPEFAAIGGCSRGNEDGLIEISATTPTTSNADGAIAKHHYFLGVNRSHTGIKDISDRDDEVFHLIRSFLRGGVAGLESVRPPEHPRDYGARPFLTFALKGYSAWLRMIYPQVVMVDSGRRYSGFKAFSVGDRTADGSRIFTVQLRPDDEGEARIYYGPGRYETVQIRRGQSAVVAEPIGAGVRMRQAVLPEAA